MTKRERQAVNVLLVELETARAWFEDTRYPRHAFAGFNEAVAEVKALVEPVTVPSGLEGWTLIDTSHD